MDLKITEPISKIHEITSQEFNVYEINSIEWRYKGLRQESKGLTFALT